MIEVWLWNFQKKKKWFWYTYLRFKSYFNNVEATNLLNFLKSEIEYFFEIYR